jgi:hypothetical protein
MMNGLLRVVVEVSRYLHLVNGSSGIERRRWFVIINGSAWRLIFVWSGLWVLIMGSSGWNGITGVNVIACTGWRFNGIAGFPRRRRMGEIERMWGRSRWLRVVMGRFVTREIRMLLVWVRG